MFEEASSKIPVIKFTAKRIIPSKHGQYILCQDYDQHSSWLTNQLTCISSRGSVATPTLHSLWPCHGYCPVWDQMDLFISFAPSTVMNPTQLGLRTEKKKHGFHIDQAIYISQEINSMITQDFVLSTLYSCLSRGYPSQWIFILQ